MIPDSSAILLTLTKEISSKRRATFTQTGTLGFPLEYDYMETYLPLNLPSVLGRRRKHVYAYPARIIAGAPEVAREHAGLALCNAITLAKNREDAILKILAELVNRILEGPIQDSTAIAEVLEETHEQLSNRAFLGQADGDSQNLEKVPDQFREMVASSIRNLLLEEWDAAVASATALSRLVNLSSLYGYIHSRELVYRHEFLLTLDIMLERYTPNSLEGLMIVVIYLMSRGSMTETRCAIPLEYLTIVRGQLDVMEERSHAATKGNPKGTLLTNALGLVETDTSTSDCPVLDDTQLTAINTLREFIDEFIVADTHASFFRHQYDCGYVDFCVDPPLMYSLGTSKAHQIKRRYLTTLCDTIKHWANVEGIETDVNWDALREVEYQEGEFDADGSDGSAEGQLYGYSEEAKMRSKALKVKPRACGVERPVDSERTPKGPVDGGNKQGKGAAAHIAVDQAQGQSDDTVTLAPSSSSRTTPIWKRRGIDNPRFLKWTPRHAQSDTLYPEAFHPKEPANAGPTQSKIGTNKGLHLEVDTEEYSPAPFSIQSLRCQPRPFCTGAHYLVAPVDPRVSTPNPEFRDAMKECDLVWRLGQTGLYQAELVDRAEEGTVRPGKWVLRQDDGLSPDSAAT